MQNQKKFTLTELISVIAIMSILVTIAVPQISEYEKGRLDTKALAYIRSAIGGQEAVYINDGKYVDCNQDTCPDLLPKFHPSQEGIVLSMITTNEGTEFTAKSHHPQGAHKYNYDSIVGFIKTKQE